MKVATSTAPGTHLFVSEAGDVLDRWQRAFPSTRGVRARDAARVVAAGGVQALWLRVQEDPWEPARVLALALPVPVILLADRPLEEEALEAFAGGARGYCNAHAIPELLQRVWSVVGAGGLWIGRPLMLRLDRAAAILATPEGRDHLASATGLSVQEFTQQQTPGAPGEPAGSRR